jgi:hypothetical protein
MKKIGYRPKGSGFEVRIRVNNRQHYVGYYGTEEKAALAADNAARFLRNFTPSPRAEFNFPPGSTGQILDEVAKIRDRLLSEDAPQWEHSNDNETPAEVISRLSFLITTVTLRLHRAVAAVADLQDSMKNHATLPPVSNIIE